MKKETDRFGTEHGIHKAQHRKMIDLHIVAVRQENPLPASSMILGEV